MKTWQLAAIGVVVVAAAGLTVPGMLEQRKADQAAAERAALVQEVQAKLDKQEAEQKAAVSARKPGVALASLRKSRSDVDEVDWYAPASMAKDDVFTAYLGDKGAAPWLRVYLSRSSGTQILMLNGVTLAAAGTRASAPGQVETSATASGRMLERIDSPADQEMVAALMAAADKKAGSIKMTGHNGAEERRLTEDELADLQRVIEAYRELGGR